MHGKAPGAPASVITCDGEDGKHEEGQGVNDGSDAGAHDMDGNCHDDRDSVGDEGDGDEKMV